MLMFLGQISIILFTAPPVESCKKGGRIRCQKGLMNLKLHRQPGPKKKTFAFQLYIHIGNSLAGNRKSAKPEHAKFAIWFVKKNDVTKFLHVGRHVEHVHDGNTTCSVHVGGQRLLLQHYFQGK